MYRPVSEDFAVVVYMDLQHLITIHFTGNWPSECLETNKKNSAMLKKIAYRKEKLAMERHFSTVIMQVMTGTNRTTLM